MKKNPIKTLGKTLAPIAGAALLCAASWAVAPSETVASVTVKEQGSAGEKCERIEPSGRSVFGKCERVCKDLKVHYDTRRNRWVCGGKVVRIRR